MVIKKRYIISAVAAMFGLIIFFLLYSIFFTNSVKKEGYLYIPTGATFNNVVDSLTNGGAQVKSTAKFRSIATLLSYDNIKSGRYKLTQGTSYLSLVRMLRSGNQSPVRLTFNNIRTIDQLAGRITANIEIDSLTMLNLLMSDTETKSIGYEPQTIIAMFIPNTYEVYWNTSPEALIQRMKREHDKFWTDSRKAQLEATGLSEVQVMTLASIVYEETKQKSEMATVAGAYINRLKIGMPLQADPTVKFAIGDFAIRRVLHAHLAVESPYNTYKYAGLPPGPICMPSISAIDAVLNYEKHNYIYFCASADLSGRHKFATSMDEHSKNAREYARALNKIKIFN